jgi:hypothetical protein
MAPNADGVRYRFGSRLSSRLRARPCHRLADGAMAQVAAAALILTLLWSSGALAGLSAELSSTSIRAGQSVVLTLSSTGPAQPAPDLTPLQQDFQVTNRSTREQVSIVNGKRRERRELRLTLMPRRSGTLTVPAIHAGDAATSPMALVVAAATLDSRLLPPPAGAGPDQPHSAAPLSLSVQASVEPQRVRVEQQLLLRVRVTSPDAMPAGRLHEPSIIGARVLPLGEDRRSETTADGETKVYERYFAIFPSTAGTLEIPPLRFDAWRVSGGDPLPFESDPLVVQVDPIPTAGSSGADLGKAGTIGTGDKKLWLPARSLSLTEAGPTTVRIAPGQALERMITLRADGIMAEDLPMIPLAIPFQLRISEDAPRLWNERTPDGVIGYRSERILIGTAEEGVYKLPGATIDWWSTKTESWQQSTLPDWTLTVAPFASADRRPAATWNRQTKTDGGGLADMGPGDPTRSADTHAAGALRTLWPGMQPWLVAAAIVIAVALLLRMLGRRRRDRTSVIPQQVTSTKEDATSAYSDSDAAMPPTPIAAAIAAIERGYRSGNATAARQAFLSWGALVWPDSAPANLAQLAKRVEPPLRDEILLLEKAFFSPKPINWTQAQPWQRLGPTADRGGRAPQGGSTADS